MMTNAVNAPVEGEEEEELPPLDGGVNGVGDEEEVNRAAGEVTSGTEVEAAPLADPVDLGVGAEVDERTAMEVAEAEVADDREEAETDGIVPVELPA